MVAAQHYQLVAFPTRDVPPTCDLVFSPTVYAGRAKLFARDPTGYPMNRGCSLAPPRLVER